MSNPDSSNLRQLLLANIPEKVRPKYATDEGFGELDNYLNNMLTVAVRAIATGEVLLTPKIREYALQLENDDINPNRLMQIAVQYLFDPPAA